MARISYGQTVWGEYFLDALNRFYRYDARVARGRAYASRGNVLDLKINRKFEIKAKVKGNYRPFYNVTLKFRPFDEDEKEKIYSLIDKNPLILASIANGELPDSFLEVLKKEKISLFPENFDELERKCSCPDWGDPCKHMASVYFMLALMIDNDPFLLFKIRGIDLIKHYNIKKAVEFEYPFKLKSKKSKPKKRDIEIVKFEDFSSFILDRLSKNPPFVSIDFHKVLNDFYKYAKKFIPTIIHEIENEKIESIQRIFQNAKFKITALEDLNYFITIEHPLLTKENLEKLFDKQKPNFTITELANYFLSFGQNSGNMQFNYLFYFFRIAYLLSISNGFIFDIIDTKNGYKAIAKPLLSSLLVQKQLDLLNNITSEILEIDGKIISADETNTILLTLFFTELIKKIEFPMKKGKGDRIYETVFSMLFRGEIIQKSFDIQKALIGLDRYFSIFDILQSDIKFTLVIEDKNGSFAMQLLANGVNINKIKKDKISVYKLLVKFSSTISKMEELTQKKEVELSLQEIEKFILEQKNIIKNLGIGVVLPKELQKLLKPALKIQAKVKSKSFKTFLSLDKLLEYNFFLSIGDEKISKEEFEKLIKEGRKIVRFKEHFVYLDPKEVESIFKQMQRHKKLSKYDLLKLKFNDEIELDSELDSFLKEIFSIKDFPLPPLNATLREYQKKGFLWAVNNLLNGFGVILADDMGLGKTLQAISVLAFLKKQNYLKNPALVVVPTTLLNNWVNEIEKFAPYLTYTLYYGAKRELKQSDIVLTSYQILRKDIEKLGQKKFDCIVIDEAQYIKNPSSLTAKSIKSIKAKYKIALSGTPVENNLSELWSIFDFALPRYLKSLKDFQQEFAKEIELNRNSEVANRLKNITAPFMLRRLKTDKSIINDLPKKIVIDEYASMQKEQAALYESFLQESMDLLKNSEPEDRSGLIFKLLIALKQICNHPRNFDESFAIDSKLSGKSQLLMELLNTILQRDEKALIFTQYTKMGDILEKMIEDELFVKPLYLKGELSKAKRDELIKEFNEDESKKIFILSLKAGGVGLNLTAANNVIHYDLWFNPAVENQATDRAFRIGQTKNVNVFRFIIKNSFEEKIDKMIKSKRELQNLSVSVGESWIGKMSDEELEALFKR